MPHILALSISSPFSLSHKTGLKSYRAVLFEDFPRTGISDIYQTRGDYDALVRTLVNTGCISDSSKILVGYPSPSFLSDVGTQTSRSPTL